MVDFCQAEGLCCSIENYFNFRNLHQKVCRTFASNTCYKMIITKGLKKEKS